MPQTSPISWINIIILTIMMILFSKSMINWNLKTKQTKEKIYKANTMIKWKF